MDLLSRKKRKKGEQRKKKSPKDIVGESRVLFAHRECRDGSQEKFEVMEEKKAEEEKSNQKNM